MLDDESDFIREMVILPETKIRDKKGNPAKTESLVPGTTVKLAGNKVNYQNLLTELTIQTEYVGNTIEMEGIIEAFDPATGVAVVDGYRLKMAEGAVIKGMDKFKGQKFTGFNTITLGGFMILEGARRNDGIVYATKGTLAENEFTESERELSAMLASEFSDKNIKPIAVPDDLKVLASSLDQGYVQFGDARFKLAENLKLQAYVNYIGNKVVPQWQKDIPFDAPERIRFRFYVIENPTFNAFALPNGMIFVHTGLLAMLDNEAQLAAVLGHEVAHVTHEHAKLRYEKQKKTGEMKEAGNLVLKVALKNYTESDILLAKLLASDFVRFGVENTVKLVQAVESLPPQTKNAIRGLATGLKGIASNEHSKEKEGQSDRVGLFYMQQAGYDPREGPKIWKKFMDLTGDGNFLTQMKKTTQDWLTTSNLYNYPNPLASAGDLIVGKVVDSATDNWFSSHPKAKTRFRNLNQLVAANYAKTDLSGAVVGAEEYKEIKMMVGSPEKKQ